MKRWLPIVLCTLGGILLGFGMGILWSIIILGGM